MDGTRFDRLTRAWYAARTRRTILHALVGLPLGGALALLRDTGLADAAQRDDAPEGAIGDEKKSRKERCRQRKGKGHGHHGRRKSCQAHHGGHHKHHKNKPCRPDAMATTCTGTCGPVTNNCQKTVDCGSCACDPPCDACFTCQEQGPHAVGVCIVDPEQQGDACGGPGQICQGDGACACDAATCTNPTPVCVDGACAICSASEPCLDGCCAGDGSCQAGDSSAICGAAGETCQACGNPTPICTNQACAACATSNACQAAGVGDLCCGGSCFTGICCDAAACAPSGNECVGHQCRCGSDPACNGSTRGCCGAPGSCINIDSDPANCGSCGHGCDADERCWNGACVCGDVCAENCQFSSVEDAVEAALPGSTITICAGDYTTSVNVFKALTLRGAGADQTILRGPGELRVMEVRDVVLLQDLTITGGNADLGGGILNRGTLTLQRVDVTSNKAVVGAGIVNFVAGGSPQLILDHSHVTLNTAASHGGGLVNQGGTITLDAGSTICDNSEPQCEGFTPPSGFCGACP